MRADTPMGEALDALAYRHQGRSIIAARADAAGQSVPDYLRTRREVRELRARAATYGLAYWPALRVGGCDPRAYAIAERVLIARTGEVWGERLPSGERSHGGWDFWGDHGLAPTTVRAAWLAAGCRDGGKFRAQVRAGIVARSSDSLPQTLALIRGTRWLAAWQHGVQLSRRAVMALGRLSPEMRHAAMRDVQPSGAVRYLPGNGQVWDADGAHTVLRTLPVPVRVRDLNWVAVAAAQALRADGSPRALVMRALALPANPARAILGDAPAGRGAPHPIRSEHAALIAPGYPRVVLAVAARIASGEPPVSIAGGDLTRREAHEWLAAGGPDAADADSVRASVLRWIVRGLPLEGRTPRDLTVARWLADVQRRGAWAALCRVQRHPDGRVMRYLDVVDEITPDDLDRGIRTGVDRAFEAAAQRLASINAGDTRTICANPFARLPRGAAILTSPAALAAEGAALQHCVGGYAAQVEAGQCVILSIATMHGRSTVELRPSGAGQWEAAQHYGARNTAPHARHAQLLRAWLATINQPRAIRRAA